MLPSSDRSIITGDRGKRIARYLPGQQGLSRDLLEVASQVQQAAAELVAPDYGFRRYNREAQQFAAETLIRMLSEDGQIPRWRGQVLGRNSHSHSRDKRAKKMIINPEPGSEIDRMNHDPRHPRYAEIKRLQSEASSFYDPNLFTPEMMALLHDIKSAGGLRYFLEDHGIDEAAEEKLQHNLPRQERVKLEEDLQVIQAIRMLGSLASYTASVGTVTQVYDTTAINRRTGRPVEVNRDRHILHLMSPNLQKPGQYNTATYDLLTLTRPSAQEHGSYELSRDGAEMLKTKYKAYIEMGVRLSSEQGRAFTTVTPHAFLGGLTQSEQRRAKRIFHAACAEVACEIDWSDVPGFKGLFVGCDDAAIDDVFVHYEQDYRLPLIAMPATDLSAPGAVMAQFGIEVNEALMGDITNIGNGATGDYGLKAFEENITRMCQILGLVFDENQNECLKQNGLQAKFMVSPQNLPDLPRSVLGNPSALNELTVDAARDVLNSRKMRKASYQGLLENKLSREVAAPSGRGVVENIQATEDGRIKLIFTSTRVRDYFKSQLRQNQVDPYDYNIEGQDAVVVSLEGLRVFHHARGEDFNISDTIENILRSESHPSVRQAFSTLQITPSLAVAQPIRPREYLSFLLSHFQQLPNGSPHEVRIQVEGDKIVLWPIGASYDFSAIKADFHAQGISFEEGESCRSSGARGGPEALRINAEQLKQYHSQKGHDSDFEIAGTVDNYMRLGQPYSGYFRRAVHHMSSPLVPQLVSPISPREYAAFLKNDVLSRHPIDAGVELRIEIDETQGSIVLWPRGGRYDFTAMKRDLRAQGIVFEEGLSCRSSRGSGPEALRLGVDALKNYHYQNGHDSQFEVDQTLDSYRARGVRYSGVFQSVPQRVVQQQPLPQQPAFMVRNTGRPALARDPVLTPAQYRGAFSRLLETRLGISSGMVSQYRSNLDPQMMIITFSDKSVAMALAKALQGLGLGFSLGHSIREYRGAARPNQKQRAISISVGEMENYLRHKDCDFDIGRTLELFLRDGIVYNSPQAKVDQSAEDSLVIKPKNIYKPDPKKRNKL